MLVTNAITSTRSNILETRADDFEIFEFFSQAGRVRDIRLIRDLRSGKSKGRARDLRRCNF